MFDLIVKNGQIVDGTGQPTFKGDIGVRKDRITLVGDLSTAEARETIDAKDRVVAPGFVDLHTHSDWTLMVDPRAESHVRQGVTTVVIGQCGSSLAPIKAPSFARQHGLFHHSSVDVTWKNIDEYLYRLEEAQPGVNVVPCVGHGTLRSAVMAREPRPANAEEIQRMVRLAEESFEQGVFGISTGLEYPPGKDSGLDELVALCSVAAKYDGFHAAHVRNRDVYYDLAFSEVISLARSTGVALQISHINPKYGRPDNAMANTLEMIRWAREDGIDVQMDMMPTNWSHTVLAAIILPSWAFSLDLPELANLLTSKEGRDKLKSNHRSMWQLVTDRKWDRIRLFATNENKKYIGMTLEEIGRDRGQDPFDVAFDLLVEEGEKAAGVICVGDSFSEGDNKLVLEDPYCSVISDSVGLAIDGIYTDSYFTPLTYNYFTRYFETYIKDQKWLSLEEGVRRATSLPASRAGLTDRGLLRAGVAADIVVFDPETFVDKSSVDQPNVYPGGIEHVIVNGQIEIQNGERLPCNAGHILRKT